MWKEADTGLLFETGEGTGIGKEEQKRAERTAFRSAYVADFNVPGWNLGAGCKKESGLDDNEQTDSDHTRPKIVGRIRLKRELSLDELAGKMSDFELQFNGEARDAQGWKVVNGRSATKEQSLHELLLQAIPKDLRWRIFNIGSPLVTQRDTSGERIGATGCNQVGTVVPVSVLDDGRGTYEGSIPLWCHGCQSLGLNFLEKEGKLRCQELGITAIHDAEETLLKVEWFGFRKGLEWSLAYLQGSSIITAIVALREACANYDLYIGDEGTSLTPMMCARKCLGCGKKKKGKRKVKLTCFPRLAQGLVSHIEEGCVHKLFQGTKDIRFEDYVNVEDAMAKWWNKRQRAFVVYVSECGHRQWPVGGYLDLEIMACAMEGVFITLIPQLVARMNNGQVWVTPTTDAMGENYPVIPSHFVSLLDPQVPWWTDCKYEIECDTDLITSWTELDQLINQQSAAHPIAAQSARLPDYDMTLIYRWLKDGMDERIQRMFDQPNYGRGIPVLISGYDLTPSVFDLQ
eukprot:2842512-Amphidinium_carterae.1